MPPGLVVMGFQTSELIPHKSGFLKGKGPLDAGLEVHCSGAGNPNFTRLAGLVETSQGLRLCSVGVSAPLCGSGGVSAYGAS